MASEALEDAVAASSGSMAAAEAFTRGASLADAAAGSPQRSGSEARGASLADAAFAAAGSPQRAGSETTRRLLGSSVAPSGSSSSSPLAGMQRSTSSSLRPSSSRLSVSSTLLPAGETPPASSFASSLLDLPPISVGRRDTQLLELDKGRSSSSGIDGVVAPPFGRGSNASSPPRPSLLPDEGLAQQQAQQQQQLPPWVHDPLHTSRSWPSLALDPAADPPSDLSDLTPPSPLQRLEDEIGLLEGRLRSLPLTAAHQPSMAPGPRPSFSTDVGDFHGSIGSRGNSGILLPGTWASSAPSGSSTSFVRGTSPLRGPWAAAADAAEAEAARSPAASDASSLRRPAASPPSLFAVGSVAGAAAAGPVSLLTRGQVGAVMREQSAGTSMRPSLGQQAWDLRDLLEGLPRASLGSSRTATSPPGTAAGNRAGLPTPASSSRAPVMPPAGRAMRPGGATFAQLQNDGSVLGGGSRDDGDDEGDATLQLPDVDDGELAMKDHIFAELLRKVRAVLGTA